MRSGPEPPAVAPRGTSRLNPRPRGGLPWQLETSKAISRRFFDEVWNRGNLDAISELAAEDIVLHDRDEGDLRGSEGARGLVSTYRSAFPDLRFTIEDQIAEGDRVATLWKATGTHQGELMGIPPTDKHSTTTGVTIDRIADGKIVESTGTWDALGLKQRHGVLSGGVDEQR